MITWLWEIWLVTWHLDIGFCKQGVGKYRSSHQMCSLKKGVLRNFAKFTGKHLCQSIFFNKVAGLRPPTLSKKRLWHMCFPVNFAKFLRTPFWQNPSGRLFLKIKKYFTFPGRSHSIIHISKMTCNTLVKMYLRNKKFHDKKY